MNDILLWFPTNHSEVHIKLEMCHVQPSITFITARTTYILILNWQTSQQQLQQLLHGREIIVIYNFS